MSKMMQVYKCNTCGNMVEIIHDGAGRLVCCGSPMDLMNEKSSDAGQEKHLPVAEITQTRISVTVGEVPHPMDDTHYIEWIEVIADGKVQRANLSPGETPEAKFENVGKSIQIRSYCNTHGLWSK
ncbi:desulfoferrodoxin [Thermodesulfobacteriota bacterium]